MRKEWLVVLCAMVLLGGPATAGATNVTWTILTSNSVAGHGPGADDVIGTGDDTTDGSESGKCNYSLALNCSAVGTPTTGTFSYAYLDFQQASSCAVGDKTGQSCTTNADCGGVGCIPCGDENWAYLYNNGSAGNKGLGSFVVNNCEDGFDYESLSLGTSEAIAESGAGCLTLNSSGANTGSPCGVGGNTSSFSLTLWVDLLGSCDFNAGVIPNVAMTGRVYSVASAATEGVCGYGASGINGLRTLVPGGGSYLMVTCAEQTLPALAAACLTDAPFKSVIVAYAGAGAGDCSDTCGGGGCMAATAEGVE